MTSIKVGDEVVRLKGDYTVGRIGKVLEIDHENNRAQVKWLYYPKSWVSITSIELTSVPYKIIEGYQKDKHTFVNPKYKRL